MVCSSLPISSGAGALGINYKSSTCALWLEGFLATASQYARTVPSQGPAIGQDDVPKSSKHHAVVSLEQQRSVAGLAGETMATKAVSCSTRSQAWMLTHTGTSTVHLGLVHPDFLQLSSAIIPSTPINTSCPPSLLLFSPPHFHTGVPVMHLLCS